MKRFNKKVVVVTGASRGIGQAICVAFAQEGAMVAGVARGELAETGAAVKAAGGKFLGINADLSQGTQKAAAGLVAQVLKEAGRVDALVNNAGVIRRAPAADFSEADWNEVLRDEFVRAVFSLSGRGEMVARRRTRKIVR